MKYIVTNMFQYFKRYARKFFWKEIYGWKKVISFYGLISLVILSSIIALVYYINPFPPKNAYLATGQNESSYQIIAEKFKNYFKKNGINLELIPTSGLGHALIGLESESSPVNASFLTAGTEKANLYPELVSLGSIQYSPIWIFYKGNPIQTLDPFEYFSNKKIAIGPAGNITNKLFRNLYELNQKSAPNKDNIVELPFKDAAAQLIAGKIDAAFIVDDYRSTTIQTLLTDHDIKILSFPLADAYVKKLPFLQKLLIPKGSIRLDSVFPSEDISILASTTTLLIEKDTHTAIQWAYLLAAKDLGASNTSFFAQPGYFPRNLDQDFPLSPIAKRFYTQGIPDVFSYLPLWLANIIENIWAYLLAFVIIIYPIYKFFIVARVFPSEKLMNSMFINLRELDEDISVATSKQQIFEIIKALNFYEQQVSKGWLFANNARFYFNLKNALKSVKNDAEKKLQELKN
jgi:uncharacterized protein